MIIIEINGYFRWFKRKTTLKIVPELFCMILPFVSLFQKSM